MPELIAETVRGLEREVRDHVPGLVLDRHDDRVRVGHAWPADVQGVEALGLRDHDGYALAPWSRLYYETGLRAREGDDGEREYAISLPAPEDLFDRFQQARERPPSDLPVAGIDARASRGVFDRFHERIEQEKLRENRLDHERYSDLAPEWSPESDHNQRLNQSADTLEAMAGSRKDAHMVDFEDVVGLRYWSLWTARHALVAGQYDHSEASGKLARRTLGVADEYQCGECDALLPPVELLSFNTYRLCDECAERRQTASAVAEARERREDEFADGLAREDSGEFGEEFHYSVRVWWHYPDEYSRGDEKQYLVSVEQGGVTASWFACDREYLAETLADLLGRWAERRIVAGRLVGPVPLGVGTVHVEDETDAGVSVTDVVPQAALSDFEGQAPIGESVQ